MKAQFLKFLMVLVVGLCGWMMWAALSAGKAQSSDGFKVGQSEEAAERRCDRFKGRTYTWIEGNVGPEHTVAACVADIKRGPELTASDYRWLQKHPAFFIFSVENNTVGSMLSVYFEPEPWIAARNRLKKFPIIKKEEKFYSNGVAYPAPVRYNEKTNLQFQTFVIEPEADTVWMFDEEHAFMLKERIYAVDMWNPELVH